MKILLALDHSDNSQRALEFVLEQLWPDGTTFHVLHVVDPRSTFELNESSAAELYISALHDALEVHRSSSNTLLSGAMERIKSAMADCDVVTSLLEDDSPADAIVEVSRSWSADLIVMGSHGRRGIDRLLLGSVSNSVLLKATCSVQIVKSKKGVTAQGLNVLISLDQSVFSRNALQAVLQRPWRSNTRFKLLTVDQSSLDTGFDEQSPRAAFEVVEHDHETMNKSRMLLSEIAADFAEHVRGQVETEVVSGDARERILDEVEKWPAHLVVLGSHGRTGLSRLFLGSVSQAVAMHAECSVEVVKTSTEKRN